MSDRLCGKFATCQRNRTSQVTALPEDGNRLAMCENKKTAARPRQVQEQAPSLVAVGYPPPNLFR